MKKVLEFGGVAAGVVLIAFGVAAIVLGVNGRSTVSTNLKQQQIVGTPDMTPSGIAAEAKTAGLPSSIPRTARARTTPRRRRRARTGSRSTTRPGMSG